MNDEEAKLKKELSDLSKPMKTQVDFSKEYSMSIDMAGQSQKQNNTIIHEANNLYTDWSQTLIDNALGIESLTEEEGKNLLATINSNSARAELISSLIEEIQLKKELIKEQKKANLEVNEEVTSLSERLELGQMYAKSIVNIASLNRDKSKANALVAKRASQLEATVNTAVAVTEYLKTKQIKKAIAVGVMGATQIATIEMARYATGGDFVTSGPQLMMVGDNPSGQERVQVTPLGGDPNIEGPQGTSNITINVSAPLVDDTVVDTLIPAINKAVSRGEILNATS